MRGEGEGEGEGECEGEGEGEGEDEGEGERDGEGEGDGTFRLVERVRVARQASGLRLGPRLWLGFGLGLVWGQSSG